MAALTKGYELSLDRLEESLDRLGVGQIDCEHLPFDPDRMKAVDVADTTDVPSGTVLEVYRAGYEWHGQVYRLAEVKVARSPTDRSAQAPGPVDLDPQAEAQDR
jgi:molecular chaperone GrpE